VEYTLKNTYSSNGQDLWILDRVGPSGYFIEVGASDGISASNCYLLEQKGWSGVAIDPYTPNYPLLIQNRKCEICCAVIDSEERTTDFLCQTKSLSGHYGLSGITDHFPSSQHKQSIIDKYGGVLQKVQTHTLTNVLRLCNAPSHIDYLSIDTEGGDYNVLLGLNFDEFSVSYISVECANPQKFIDLLEPHKFRLIYDFKPWPDKMFGREN